MLYFLHKPDPVFRTILTAALETELTTLQASLEDADSAYWDICYPYTSRCFASQQAVPILERLVIATRETNVYLITDYHWLFVWECLRNYCTSVNELALSNPGRFLFVGDYPLERVHFDNIISIYFWDTDFLVSKDMFEQLSAEDRKRVRLSDSSAVSRVEGWEIHPSELQMRRIDHPQWLKPTLSRWFRPGSPCYPDGDPKDSELSTLMASGEDPALKPPP